MYQKNTGKTARRIVVGQEESDIAQAIALSLKESETKRVGLYPSTVNNVTSLSSQPKKLTTNVRALYDFEAAEENELSFKAGEIINNVDMSNEHWWTGSSSRGQGMFPAQFVTTDVPIDKSNEASEKTNLKNKQQFDLSRPPTPVIDETKIDACINLIEDSDPTGELRNDSAELAKFEAQCRQMGPLIDQELEKVDRRYNTLAEINSKIMKSFQMYNGLMTQGGMARPTNYVWQSQPTLPQYMPQDQFPQGIPQRQNQEAYTNPLPQQTMGSMRFQAINYSGGVDNIQTHVPDSNTPTDHNPTPYVQPPHMLLDQDRQSWSTRSSNNNALDQVPFVLNQTTMAGNRNNM